ncbi:penicillin-binding protein 1C [Corticibacter populi]|uniref:peptidoglycan glycosyltransferase n=1 Tax=Corticibacter populi TaxID=1550736 RepID=A0A3M6QIX0_9BURK|nr:penicillin-binding protein 1C [Corticibacter populi]RMX03030.1 penicillin-binding protein 1C [Corticibacter populi]RZS33463.1 penicillin-binding protein 1C [Corticibacter populi]
MRSLRRLIATAALGAGALWLAGPSAAWAQTQAQAQTQRQSPRQAQTEAPAVLPGFEAVRQDWRASETWLLDRHGQRLQRVRTDFSVRRGDWVALEDMSPALLHAIVLTEDKRFYEHSGVDWSAVSAAAWSNLWNERTRGASTITMQLAGLLNESLRSRAGGRSWQQKWRQLWSARDLEDLWSKAEILEAYLNLVPFRGEMVGIDALSRSLFDKAPDGLDLRESAIAAALLRAPNAPVATVAQRACLALQQGGSHWGGDCKALALYTTAALQRRHFNPVSGPAPHFAHHLLARQRQPAAGQAEDGHAEQSIVTSLDARIQRHALRSLHTHLGALQGRNVQDGAVLVLDNASGEVLAWVGSSGQALSRAAEVDAVLAPRQPGSTLKPFLYAQAIAQRRLTAASLLHDSPASIPTEFGIYAPQNYDEGYKGWVSVRQALGSSLNIPAVRALRMVSPEAFSQQLRALGLSLPEPSGYYGYSLALGGVDASLLELTNAYRTLANGGWHSDVRLTPRQARNSAEDQAENRADDTGGQRVLDAAVAFIVTDMLADRHARVLTFGTDSQLATRFWSAVKTGTSKDMRDNWAIGFTPRFTIGVWVGNADGSPMQEVSGVSGAAPVWADVAAYLHRLQPAHAPAPPAALVHQAVHYDIPAGNARERFQEADRLEWFLPGTEQAVFSLNVPDEVPDEPPADTVTGGAEAARARILRPDSGTILALDPDIPPHNQMLRLSASRADVRWYVNQQPVTGLTDARNWYWPPMPGRHRIELRSADGERLLDAVQIEVRGASLKTSGE